MNEYELIIRPMIFNDLEFFLEIRNECRGMLHDNRIFTIEEAIDWFKKSSPRYSILENNQNRIGYFRTSNWDEKNKHVYIGCDLHQDYRGRGFAKQGYKQFIEYLFKTYDLNKISLEVLSTNNTAYQLYKKLGFVVDGVKRDDIYRDGIYIDSIIMSILRKEW